MDCIKEIKPIESDTVVMRDLLFALIKECGARVSSMPDEIEGQTVYSDRYELFDPEKVRTVDIPNLPEPWNQAYAIHMRPDMRDCRTLRYRYIHVPEKILANYPRLPCKGIFGLTERRVRANQIKAKDLIFIGNEFK